MWDASHNLSCLRASLSHEVRTKGRSWQHQQPRQKHVLVVKHLQTFRTTSRKQDLSPSFQQPAHTPKQLHLCTSTPTTFLPSPHQTICFWTSHHSFSGASISWPLNLTNFHSPEDQPSMDTAIRTPRPCCYPSDLCTIQQQTRQGLKVMSM